MTVHNNEWVARFIVSEGWVNQGQVKGEAFRPKQNRKKSALETSVTKHEGRDAAEIKKRSKEFEQIPRLNPVNVLGWADVTAGAVRTVSTIPALDLEAAATIRDSNHANIVGWHLESGQQMIQAEEIARQSKLCLL